jgi:hypothetical protein
MSDPPLFFARYRPAPDVIARRIKDEVVLVQLKTERILVLNLTAVRFWVLLCQGCDWPEILTRMSAEFEVKEEQLQLEIQQILEQMQRERLLVEYEPS